MSHNIKASWLQHSELTLICLITVQLPIRLCASAGVSSIDTEMKNQIKTNGVSKLTDASRSLKRQGCNQHTNDDGCF